MIRNYHSSGQRCTHWHTLLIASSAGVLPQTVALIGVKHCILWMRSIGVNPTDRHQPQTRWVTILVMIFFISSFTQMLHMATESCQGHSSLCECASGAMSTLGYRHLPWPQNSSELLFLPNKLQALVTKRTGNQTGGRAKRALQVVNGQCWS